MVGHSQRSKMYAYLVRHVSEVEAGGAAFRIHYWGMMEKHYDNPVHKHSFFEICYCVDGEGDYTDDGAEYKLSKGTMFVSRPGIWHQIRSEKGMFLLYVAFELRREASSAAAAESFERLAGTGNVVLRETDDTTTALLWRGLLLPSEETPLLSEEAVKSLTHALLLSFCSQFGERADGLPQADAGTDSARLLRQAVTFIKDNLSGPLRLDSVAAYFHISGRHLSRLFSAQLGMSFVAFVQQERIRHAAHLLRHSPLSVKHIAEQTGFESVHYFTRSFTKAMGMPPGKYRERSDRL